MKKGEGVGVNLSAGNGEAVQGRKGAFEGRKRSRKGEGVRPKGRGTGGLCSRGRGTVAIQDLNCRKGVGKGRKMRGRG